MTNEAVRIMILVHPGSACGSADFNLEHAAPPLRDALAAEVMEWQGDLMVVDGELSDELDHYALIGLAIQNAADVAGRRMIREHACDMSHDDWPLRVERRYRDEWPGGPHEVVITGAWYGEDGGDGCVNAVARRLRDQNVTISECALRI